ncbi:hypothetical protein E2C01_021617 [Portunus trituberculatus]|uniref:Reverse transcriptase RNase H-like domain-containing protein n=1 Tax=Portunus trituberculatus TaxID=210409 RepID=A0A5B7E562_PORTR|nr:hypothetical protein [Portunus trituberculatus]
MVLSTDASAEAVQVVLQQEVTRELRSFAFFTELLVVYEAVRHFHHFLEGREFQVLTDHKPLAHPMAQTGDNFTPPIHHGPQAHSEENTAVDALSHGNAPTLTVTALSSTPPLDNILVVAAQENDPELQALLEGPTSLQLVQQ